MYRLDKEIRNLFFDKYVLAARGGEVKIRHSLLSYSLGLEICNPFGRMVYETKLCALCQVCGNCYNHKKHHRIFKFFPSSLGN